jgi:hypothetical protein
MADAESAEREYPAEGAEMNVPEDRRHMEEAAVRTDGHPERAGAGTRGKKTAENAGAGTAESGPEEKATAAADMMIAGIMLPAGRNGSFQDARSGQISSVTMRAAGNLSLAGTQ